MLPSFDRLTDQFNAIVFNHIISALLLMFGVGVKIRGFNVYMLLLPVILSTSQMD